MSMAVACTTSRLVFFLLCLLTLTGLSSAGKAAPYAALVVEVKSEKVLFEQNAHQLRYPASLTKMMTLYLVFEALERGRFTLNQRLLVSKRAAARPPSKLGLRVGDTITVEQAILALVTRSANDVATVVAEALSGSETAFAQQMTQAAQALGMWNSVFRNASGLPDGRQVTTAWDMFRLAKALQEHFPDYYRYFATTHFSYRNKNHRNHNRLLTSYTGTDGIKTGYIRASGYNLVASVHRNERHIIGVVFGGETAKSRNKHMEAILDQGFAQLAAEHFDTDVVYRNNLLTLIAKGKLSEAVLRDEQPDKILPATTRRLSAEDKGGNDQFKQLNSSSPNWRVQVGTFSRLAGAEQRIFEAMRAAPAFLSREHASIVPLQQRGKALFRARFDGLSQAEAGAACQRLRQQRIDCLLLAPTG
jgi:D-alanyl-D-alanine carboxypeptidase